MNSSSNLPTMDVPQLSGRHGSENNKVAKSECRDRLSELPDSLILVILSLLQMKDVVATSILSKRWRCLWTTVPCLDFWYHSYDLHEYRSFIYAALAQWKGPKLLKFTITFSHFYPRSSDISSWMLFAIEKQVAELSILLGSLRDNDLDYRPPQRLYSCSSITKLSLAYCQLRIEKKVEWDQLKSLTIEGAVSSRFLTAYAMNKILSGVPRLEELKLFIRHIDESFNIRSTSLKILRFGFDDFCFGATYVDPNSVLSVWAPNLLTLQFLGGIRGSCLFYVPSLTNAVLYFLNIGNEAYSGDYLPHMKQLHQVFQSIRHVKNVTLSNWCIKFLLQMKNIPMVMYFSNVECLKLYTAGEIDEMLDVLELFPNLRRLIAELDRFPKSGYLASKTRTHEPLPLKTVEITWSLGFPSLFPLIEMLLEKAFVLKTMVLRLEFSEHHQDMFIMALQKVLSMPRSSRRAKVIVFRDTPILESNFLLGL